MKNKTGHPIFEDDPKKLLELSPEQELDRQYNELEFKTSMCCFSIIRFITDFMMELNPHITH